jgi:prevent-host-death family protein
MIARSSKWQFSEAKNKLSEVIRRAREEGPQTITVRGEDAVTISRAPDVCDENPKENLWEYFQRSPAAGIDFFVPPLSRPERDSSFLFEDDDQE